MSFNKLSNLRMIIFLYDVPINPPFVSDDLGLTNYDVLILLRTSRCLLLLILNLPLKTLHFLFISFTGDFGLSYASRSYLAFISEYFI